MADFGMTGSDALNMPYSPEAEQSVLGALIMEPSCLDRVMEIIPNPDYFYILTHKVIYGKMLELFTESRAIDSVTLIESLRAEKDFDETTGKTYIYDLVNACPSV